MSNAHSTDASSSSSSSSNKKNNNTHPATETTFLIGSSYAPNQGATPSATKKKGSRLSTYYEYKLDDTYDSKGGYLTENNQAPSATTLPEKLSVATLGNRKIVHPPPLILDPTSQPTCQECASVDIDPTYKEHFHTWVCSTCKKALPEKYALLTKTEVREDYLLTEPELRDHTRLPVLKKPNPRQPRYHAMWLYMRAQVEQFAMAKWGSLAALDAELDARDAERAVKRERRYKQKLCELRRATRTSLWYAAEPAPTAETQHVHVWADGADGQQVCEGCGSVSEVLDF